MYRLLIAEDELWLRRRLVATIDWEKYGISVVQEAEDGAEALMLALSEEPDIIITDIRMPELSGIDLMKALNESSVYPKTIVVSGYNDFEYAQKALKMGAVNYLLKPVEEEELIKSVKQCVSDLEQEHKNRMIFDKQLEISELLIKHIYEEAIFGYTSQIKGSLSVWDKICDGRTCFPAKYACVVNVEVLNIGFYENDDLKTDIWLIHQCLENGIQEKLQNFLKKSYSFIRENRIVLLLFSDESYDTFLEYISGLKGTIEEVLKSKVGYPLVISPGSIVDNFADIHDSYENVLLHTKYEQERIEGGNYSPEKDSFEDVYADYNYQSMIKEIRNGNSKRAVEELHILLQTSFKRLKNVEIIKIQLFYINIINKIASACLPECEANSAKLAVQCLTEIREITTIGTEGAALQIKESLENFVQKLAQIYIDNSGNKRHWLMDQIIQYAEENYNTSLSTRDIAQRFFMNSSYFSKLFHEQMGCTFSNYLIRIRIEKAKIMLTQTNMKLYDIAYAVGYSNVQYFSTIFKEKEGITPSKYRQLRFASNDGDLE